MKNQFSYNDNSRCLHMYLMPLYIGTNVYVKTYMTNLSQPKEGNNFFNQLKR